MKQILPVLLILLIGIAARAQQPISQAADSSDPPAQAGLVSPPITSQRIQPIFALGSHRLSQESDGQQVRWPLHATQARFQLFRGSLYLTGVGLAPVPVPGGGASGCFSLDLSERAGSLRRFNADFPSRRFPVNKPLIGVIFDSSGMLLFPERH